MIDRGRYTSGRIAVANLSAAIDSLDRGRGAATGYADLLPLSTLLFLRGDLLGRIADHDRASQVAAEAVERSPDRASGLFIRARLAGRFHRFPEAGALLDRALAAGHPEREVDGERAALLQGTGRYAEALRLRERMAQDDPRIDTLGGLASLLAEMDQWAAAESCWLAALEGDTGVSPLPAGQLLFEWGVSAMRRGELGLAEARLGELDTILPQHVPGRGHRAEVALGRGKLDLALALAAPLVDASDDPEYRATYAEILAARGEHEAAARETEHAEAAYELLLARRPEAYADHAAAFFLGIGARPERAAELALLNWSLRDTPRSRRLLAKAREAAAERTEKVA
jgi:tetratricopeptide (TPR) repeat protein